MGCTALDILNTTELHTSEGYIAKHVNVSSVKLLKIRDLRPVGGADPSWVNKETNGSKVINNHNT